MKYIMSFIVGASLAIALIITDEVHGFTKKHPDVPAVTTTTVVTAPSQTTTTVVNPDGSVTEDNGKVTSLYWENTTEPHPERKPWSQLLVNEIEQSFGIFNSAKDLTVICPKYLSLGYSQRVKALAEFWVATAYYESGFNPLLNSVDVGKKGNLDTYSVGLYQVSVVDAGNIYKYTFKELQNPLNNIRVTMEIARRQIKNGGAFMLDNSSKHRYWAVLLKGNKYSKIPQILERVKKQAPSCY